MSDFSFDKALENRDETVNRMYDYILSELTKHLKNDVGSKIWKIHTGLTDSPRKPRKISFRWSQKGCALKVLMYITKKGLNIGDMRGFDDYDAAKEYWESLAVYGRRLYSLSTDEPPQLIRNP